MSVVTLTDHELKEACGTASCGCVYHAEDGVPCEHDVELAKERKSRGISGVILPTDGGAGEASVHSS